MFIVFLYFSKNKDQASTYMEQHNQWLQQGFEENTFLLAGSINPDLGGSIIATGLSRNDLEKKVNLDPFVEKDIVHYEIIEIDIKKTDPRLHFLLNKNE